jgi:hypothetical protein
MQKILSHLTLRVKKYITFNIKNKDIDENVGGFIDKTIPRF